MTHTFEKMTSGEFASAIVAQADSGGYDPSGWLCGIHEGVAFIDPFGHCSCYGTWEAVNGGGISDSYGACDYTPLWSGTIHELDSMASKKLDPNMPERIINTEDYDSGYLSEMCVQVITYIDQQASSEEEL